MSYQSRERGAIAGSAVLTPFDDTGDEGGWRFLVEAPGLRSVRLEIDKSDGESLNGLVVEPLASWFAARE